MYYIISNPISGRKKQTNKSVPYVVKKYLDEKQIEYQWYDTEYELHTIELAKKLDSEVGGGNLILIGGDGTFNEVINGLSDLSKWNIGLIPAGSGNDFANALGLKKKEPIKNIELILKNNVIATDYINVNNMRCLNVLGTGIDVEVLRKFEKLTKLKGKFRYFVALVQALLHFNWYEFDISIDGNEFVHKKGFIATICNGCSFGGGITICPGANIDDGKFEFVFVNQIKKILIPFYLIKLMSKKIMSVKACEHLYCEKAIIKTNSEDFVLQIDGNMNDKDKIYECNIVKNGIKLYR